VSRSALRSATAVFALGAAVLLTLLAIDVLRTPGHIARDDAAFYGAPLRQTAPWGAVDSLPWRPAEHVLGIGDDLRYRKTISLFERSHVQLAGPNQPLLEALRGKAVLEVADQARFQSDPQRRAQLLNMNGVSTFSRYSTFTSFDKDRLLREAIGDFRNAVRLDPTNADARANLELALRAAKGSGIPGEDPDAGASQGKRSGVGRRGSGY
jgi:hypothetical protein